LLHLARGEMLDGEEVEEQEALVLGGAVGPEAVVEQQGRAFLGDGDVGGDAGELVGAFEAGAGGRRA